MSKTETVHTEYGAVSIETVECDSCATAVAKDEAYSYVVCGEHKERTTTDKVYDVEQSGNVCPHCADVAPVRLEQSTDKTPVLERVIMSIADSTRILWYDYELGGTHPGKAAVWLFTLGTIGMVFAGFLMSLF